MPGIVGIITRMPRARAEADVVRMVASIRHESFYHTGFWSDEAAGIYLGWTTHMSASSEAMPIHNEDGSISLLFSGEDHPDPAVPARLVRGGHSLDLQGRSYLVHQYEEDPGFLASLNGMFHGILIDRRRDLTVLFNDRYGMHRLYYHESRDAFYFAVEAKAILGVLPELRSPDAQAMGEFVACSCALEDRTIFAGIKVLPPAAAWTFGGGVLRSTGRYFAPSEWEQQEPLDPEAYYLGIRDSFSTTLARYFGGSQPVALAVTGGLDTRNILAWKNPSPGSLPCYTYGGMFRDCQDVRLGRRVATLCKQSHKVLGVTDDFLSQFPRYAMRTAYLTEGGVDISNSPDLYLSERAREIAPIKIVGTYGSEIICQAVMFKPVMPLPGLFHPDFQPHIDSGQRTYYTLRKEHPLTFVAIRQSQWHHVGIFALEQTQLTVRAPFLDNAFVRDAYRAPVVRDVRPRMIRDGNSTLARLRSDRGIHDTSSFSGALARLFLEFTFKAEYAYDYGMPQWLARVDHLLSALRLERLFLGRHKFAHFRIWYRDQLAGYVKDILLDPRSLRRPYLQRHLVESVVAAHVSGRFNYTTTIHTLLTLELLHRLFFD